MEQQYYTPAIEDIRVGYECEIMSNWDGRRSDFKYITQSAFFPSYTE